MNQITKQQIQIILENLILFLKPNLHLINSHMVDFYTKELWINLIPDNIKDEIQDKNDVDNAIELFFKHKVVTEENVFSSKYKNFYSFLSKTASLNIENLNIAIDINTFYKRYDSLMPNNVIEIKDFMSLKKHHEVTVLSNLLTTVISNKSNNEICIIEAGDGKGYLSARLAMELKNIKILGIDSNLINTNNAKKRKKQLERAWTGLTKRAEDLQNGIQPKRHGRKKLQTKGNNMQKLLNNVDNQNNYRTITKFITPHINLVELYNEHFKAAIPNDTNIEFLLSGLHTCGNLSSTCLNLFTNNDNIKTLCNVGCCYHLLTELDDEADLELNDCYIGFPMSNYFKDQNFTIGRNARMLAQQSIERVISVNDLPKKTLFYRSLFELLIKKELSAYKDIPLNIGKIKANDFTDYTKKCLKKLYNKNKHELIINDELIINFYHKYYHNENLLYLYYLLRMSFAKIIETLILLDRLLYLLENNINTVHLIKLFDEVISPRCYGIYAFK